VKRAKIQKGYKLREIDLLLEDPDPYFLAALNLGNSKDAYYFYTQFDIEELYELLAQKLAKDYEPLPPKWQDNI